MTMHGTKKHKKLQLMLSEQHYNFHIALLTR